MMDWIHVNEIEFPKGDFLAIGRELRRDAECVMRNDYGKNGPAAMIKFMRVNLTLYTGVFLVGKAES